MQVLKQDLPEGWAFLTLGDIKPSTERFDPTKGKNRRCVGLEHIAKDTGVILGTQDSKSTASSKTVFRSGDLLYGKLRPYLNKVAIPDFDGVCSTDILVFRENSFVSNTFLKYCLLKPDFVRFANSTTSGVHHPRTSHKKLSAYPIPLPPLSEQKRIVSRLESIFSRIDACRGELERLVPQTRSASGSLDALRSSVLKQAFEGKLVPQDPDDEPAKELLDRLHSNSDKRPEFDNEGLPNGWVRFQYGKYLQLDYGKGLPKKHRSDKGKFPVYGSSGITGFCDKFLLRDPCLIIGRKGSAGKVHLTTVPSWPIDTTYYVDKFPMYEQKFLYFLLQEMNLSKLDSSTAIPSLRRDDVYALHVILPPLNEQRRIVTKIESIFSGIDAIEQTVNQSIAALGALRQSVLKQAFEGRLVPQDPDDEPASVILERIKNAKPQVSKGRKHGK